MADHFSWAHHTSNWAHTNRLRRRVRRPVHGHRRRKCHRPFARGSACAKRPIRKGQLPSRGCLGGSARQNTKRWLTAGKEKRFHKDWFALLIYTSWRRHILFIISFLAFLYSHSKPKRGHTRTTTVTMKRSLLLRTKTESQQGHCWATVRLSPPRAVGEVVGRPRHQRPSRWPPIVR